MYMYTHVLYVVALNPASQVQWTLSGWKNTQIWNQYKLFASAFMITAFTRGFVWWWRCFYFPRHDKVNIMDTHHNQPVYPDFPYSQPKPSSSSLGHNSKLHSISMYSTLLHCRLGGGRGGWKYMAVCFSLNGKPPSHKKPGCLPVITMWSDSTWISWDWLNTLGLTAITWIFW